MRRKLTLGIFLGAALRMVSSSTPHYLIKNEKETSMLEKKTRKRCISLILSSAIMICSIFNLAVFPMGVSAATQATYYVSPSGSDSNPGTIDAPFKTITKARDIVRTINSNMTQDICVYLRGGNYSITNTITFGTQDSGTNGYRIYYQAYPGETPVLNGATKVTGWTQYNGNIYKATLNRATKLRNLYVNDQRALMTKKTVTAKGGNGTYSVIAGQADWAWTSGSKSDGVQYNTADVPVIKSNKDDLEIVNGTTWNENIVCTRDVITSGNYRVLLLQQPYGAIAQTPGWGAAFTTTGTHTIYNAFEFLNSPGQFYFDKTTKTLYYYPRPGENMATADVEAPVIEQLINISGTSITNRVKNITFKGITFANSDYNLVNVGGSHGKTTCQGANGYIAFDNGNWHNTKYDILDTLPGMINVISSDSINFTGNIIKHSGSDGITMVNDVINSNITSNYITDITSSGITVGHPQHVYIGDRSTHAKYASGVEGVCKNNTITNNMMYNISTAPGFGGCAAIMAYFVDTLKITYNQIQTTAYNGINLGWGWNNFLDSTTCKNNTVSYNRLINTLNRLYDSGAIYTIGQMPGTNINENYVKGIPPATSGPTYGLHNDEGSAYITENDNVLDIDPKVKYTINCEDFGKKHDLTILRTYATVSKMGVNPPKSTIDTPVAVSDNVWPLAQYNTCLNSGIKEEYRNIIPSSLLSTQDYVFPASCYTTAESDISIRSSGNPSNIIWFAPAGTVSFAVGQTMTKAAGTATSITTPATAGTYKLYIVNSSGTKIGESDAELRVSGSASQIEAESYTAQSGIQTESCSEGGQDIGNIENGDYAVYNNINFSSGVKSFQARVASGASGGNIEIRLDSITGSLIGTCPVAGTGGWQTWVTKSCDVSGVTGVHDLYLKFTGGSGYLFNVNWWQFSGNGTTEPTNPMGSTVTLTDGWYYIKNVNAQKYLQVANNTGKAAQNVELGTGSKLAGQKWYLTNVGNGYVTLKSALGEYALDVNKGEDTDGANIQIYNAYSNDAQKYSIKTSSTKGAYAIATMASKETKVLDGYKAETADGTNVCQWSYGGNNNQLWIFEPTSNTTPTYKLGDVNKSGTIDVIDCIQLKKLLINDSSVADLTVADMNKDGKVNIIDYVQLKKLLIS